PDRHDGRAALVLDLHLELMATLGRQDAPAGQCDEAVVLLDDMAVGRGVTDQSLAVCVDSEGGRSHARRCGEHLRRSPCGGLPRRGPDRTRDDGGQQDEESYQEPQSRGPPLGQETSFPRSTSRTY